MSNNYYKFNHGMEDIMDGSQSWNRQSSTPYSLNSYYTTSASTTTANTMFSQGYVEWYWVALGLIVPIVLGSLFCILDHVRRKKSHRQKHTEQRLESMCERNKYVPPSYEEVIPNDIVIDSIPGIHTLPPPQHSVDRQEVTHAVPDEVVVVVSHATTCAATNQKVESSSPAREQLSVPDTTDSISIISGTSDFGYSDMAFDDVDPGTEAPPSYDEYHKYELYGSYGSTTHLV